MLKSKSLAGFFWGEAVVTTVFILNRAPTCALDGVTPYEARHGVKLAVYFFRTFGCVAHVKDTRPNLKKLDDRSRRAIFVGYEPGSKAYRCYDPETGRVVVSRNVVFDENAQWGWCGGDDQVEREPEPFAGEYEVAHLPG